MVPKMKYNYSVRVPAFITERINEGWIIDKMFIYSKPEQDDDCSYGMSEVELREFFIIKHPEVNTNFIVMTEVSTDKTLKFLHESFRGKMYFLEGLEGVTGLTSLDNRDRYKRFVRVSRDLINKPIKTILNIEKLEDISEVSLEDFTGDSDYMLMRNIYANLRG